MCTGSFCSIKTKHSVNVNTTSSLVANRSNNAANPNSSVSYLNVNNTPSNSNPNISSQLLTVDSISLVLVIAIKHSRTLSIYMVTFKATLPFRKDKHEE